MVPPLTTSTVVTHLTSDDRQFWEKLPREGTKAFAAFALYRDLGPRRSLAKAAAAHIESISTARKADTVKAQFAKWSAAWHWRQRIAAYDVYLDRRYREGIESEKERFLRARSTIGEMLQAVALTRIRGGPSPHSDSLVEAIDPGTLTFNDVARGIQIGDKLQALALGMTPDLVGASLHISSSDFRRVTDDLIKAALSLMADEQKNEYVRRVEAIAAGSGSDRRAATAHSAETTSTWRLRS